MYLTYGELNRIINLIETLNHLEALNGEDWVEFETKVVDSNGEVAGTISRSPGSTREYVFYPNTSEDE